MKNQASTKDYLAIISIGGGSTFGRGESIYDAVEGAARFLALDFGSYYDIAGKGFVVAVYDVTGMDEIHWEHAGHAYEWKDGKAGPQLVTERAIILTTPELTGRLKVSSPRYLSALRDVVARACSQEVAA